MQADLASQKALLQNADIFSKLREEVKAEKLATVQAEIKRLETAIGIATAQQRGLEEEVRQRLKEAERFSGATVDMEMLRSDIKNAETVLAALATERDKLKVEMRAMPRVTLLQRAEASDSSTPIPAQPAAEEPPRAEK
jgi:septal ring factor EnvC (AmiA/AmiB activator)